MDCKGFTAVMVALLLAVASASQGADFLYIPQPAATAPADAEGILVREVTVKRGDTLSHLAKQYAGRGYYYPQILLFNSIKNPHRIYPGQVLRVPLAHKAVAVAQTQPAATAEQTVETAPEPAVEKPVKKSKRIINKPDDRSRRTAHATAAERAAYNEAKIAFSRGDCNRAITLFDSFIARYPSSTRIAEATLNRAECYLKLSGN